MSKTVKNINQSSSKGKSIKKSSTKTSKKSSSKSNESFKDLAKIIKNPSDYAQSLDIKDLVKVLQKMSDKYVKSGDPYVSDEIYDIMIDNLKERDPKNKFLKQTGVGKRDKNDVDLPFNMPSLNKIKPGEKSLQKWFQTYHGPYVIMDKLDGISMQIYKDKDGNVDLFTKKQTDVGTSKKYLLKYLVDKKILDKLPNDTSVRGELVIAKKDFEKVLKIYPDMKNERSLMAGFVNRDTVDQKIAPYAKLVTYSILNSKETISEQLRQLNKFGFNVVWNDTIELDEEYDDDEEDDFMDLEMKLVREMKNRIQDSDFLIDGIVIYDDAKAYPLTADKPKYAMAFKMNLTDDMRDTIVKKVEWDISMHGYLQPVVVVEPTSVPGNVTIERLTAHNAKYIVANNIGKGAKIRIVRSNGVIPYIVDVIKPAQKPGMPDVPYEWDDKKVKIFATKLTDDLKRSMIIKKMAHFFKKINVKHLSDKTLEKLYDAGYEDIVSIIEAANTKDHSIMDLPRMGEKNVEKIYDQIDKAFEKIKLVNLMVGPVVFGEGLGVRKINEILKIYPDILSMESLKVSEITDAVLKVKGFSDKLASRFAEGFHKFMKFLNILRKNTDYDLSFNNKKSSDKSDKKHSNKKSKVDFSKEKIVMTGFRSDPIAEFIENNGGTIASSVSKNTTMVIYVENDKVQSKLVKARELGVKTITRDQFESKYMN